MLVLLMELEKAKIKEDGMRYDPHCRCRIPSHQIHLHREGQANRSLNSLRLAPACSVPRGRPGIRGLEREVKGTGATPEEALMA